jgi:signal transduction histidine kinase
MMTLVVEDDGAAKFDHTAGGRGLDNMRARAARLGGALSIEPRDDKGTRLTWSARLVRLA